MSDTGEGLLVTGSSTERPGDVYEPAWLDTNLPAWLRWEFLRRSPCYQKDFKHLRMLLPNESEGKLTEEELAARSPELAGLLYRFRFVYGIRGPLMPPDAPSGTDPDVDGRRFGPPSGATLYKHEPFFESLLSRVVESDGEWPTVRYSKGSLMACGRLDEMVSPSGDIVLELDATLPKTRLAKTVAEVVGELQAALPGLRRLGRTQSEEQYEDYLRVYDGIHGWDGSKRGSTPTYDSIAASLFAGEYEVSPEAAIKRVQRCYRRAYQLIHGYDPPPRRVEA